MGDVKVLAKKSEIFHQNTGYEGQFRCLAESMESRLTDVPITEDFRTSDIQDAFLSLDGIDANLGQIGALDGIHHIAAVSEDMYPTFSGHSQELHHVREESRRPDNGIVHSGAAELIDELLFGPDDFEVRHLVSIDHRYINEFGNALRKRPFQQIPVTAIVDIICESVLLSGDSHRRNDGIHPGPEPGRSIPVFSVSEPT
jgi:hypothetical protein